jgi:protease IV
MSLDSDAIVDRRRMRRKLTFWRALVVLVVIGAIAFAALRFTGTSVTGLPETGSNFIARVKIKGLIRTDDDRTDALDRLAKSGAKAVIVRIDSPGGTVVGSQQLYDSLRRIAAQKPLVVVVDGLAASGGYIAAMASDQIIAQEMSLVGSIGVLFQYPEMHEALAKLGVKMETVRSTPLKAAPSGFEPTSPEARAALEAIVRDTYDWFKTMVRTRRSLDDAQMTTASDGRVFTGRQGVALKLVDQLGDEHTALAWLEKEKGVDAKTRVRDWKLTPRLSDLPFLHVAGIEFLDAVGLSSFARRLEGSAVIQTIEKLNLDGLLALWHPSSNN